MAICLFTDLFIHQHWFLHPRAHCRNNRTLLRTYGNFYFIFPISFFPSDKRDSQLSEREKALPQLRRKLSSAESQREEAASEVRRYQAEFERLSSQNKKTVEDLEALKAIMQRRREELLAAEREKKEQASEVERLKEALGSSEAEIKSLRESNHQLLSEQVTYLRQQQDKLLR